jgi:DNA polymerase-1
MRILLIDGPAIAYRSHFALAKANLTTAEGQSTAATFGYTNALLKLLRQEEPEYACVAFDTEEPTYRHELFEEYKADRPGMPDELAGQLSWIKDITERLGIRVLEVDGYEADDIIGTLAEKAAERGIDTVIATGDKDLLQLVRPGARVIMLSGWGRDTKIMDEKAVKAKYGIPPGLLPDYYGLMGDSIDNVPGVPGIGPKTAGALVKEFGRLEVMYERIDSVEPPRVRSLLARNKEAAFSSRDLVTVHKEVPLGVEIDDLRLGKPDEEPIRDIFMRLGFRRLLRQVVGEHTLPDAETVVWQEATGMGSEMTLKVSGNVGVYVNLDGATAATSQILGIALCSEGDRYYFPLNHREPCNIGVEEFRRAASPVLARSEIPKAAHDAKKVIVSLKRFGIDVAGVESDSLLAAYLLSPGQSAQDVEGLAADYLGQVMPDEGKRGSKVQLVTLKQASERCCLRASVLVEMCRVMEADLRSKDLYGLYKDVELPLARVLADMEMRGVKIDRGCLETLATELDKKLDALERGAFALAGRRFNLNSPKDVSHVLFDEIGLKPRRKTKRGYSTDLNVLTELSTEHELPRTILEHRQLAKLKSTYVDQLLRYADPVTGRIHANFNQTVTATGRLSSSDPNLQNIPIRTDIGARIRKAFIASHADWTLLSADYSQIELRILAHLSGDAGLMEAFAKGEDIHTKTASLIFKADPAQVTVAMRSIAKSVNFGIVYGMGPQGLARATGLDIEEAQRFLEQHRLSYPGVYTYIEQSLEKARTQGFVETVLGRKRYLPNLVSSEPALRSAAERMAVNTPIQGSAADIIKIAMLGVFEEMGRRGLAGGIVVQVHDEILVDCPESERAEIEGLLKDKMTKAYALSVPLKVELGGGKTWYEAH